MGVWPDLYIYSFYYRYWRSLTANISLPVRTLAISIRVLYSSQLVTAETWQTGALTPLGLPGNGGEGEGAGQQGDVQEGGGHLAGSHITWGSQSNTDSSRDSVSGNIHSESSSCCPSVWSHKITRAGDIQLTITKICFEYFVGGTEGERREGGNSKTSWGHLPVMCL